MPPIAQLFAKKAAPLEAVLGAKQGKITFDEDKNCLFQLFEHGVVIGKFDAAKLSQLTCTYGKLFSAWWGNSGAEWLGEPLEDLYETTNFKWDFSAKKRIEGDKIMVQRFERGVIWCRSDGSDDVRWLSWRDWHAISRPGDEGDKHR
jgi:hypothetical protein